MSRRLLNGLTLLAIIGILCFALYLQYFKGEDPCPLCIFQRVAYLLLGIFLLLDWLHNPKKWGVYIYSLFQGMSALAGIVLAGRQVWLQHLPPELVPSCGPGLSYILATHPLLKAFSIVLQGSGDCAVVSWRYLNLSLAQWSLCLFITFFFLTLINTLNRR
ncbi:MAG: disulfide bond formation protein B [Ferrovum sp. 37-45-19]|uniref:disulfide bond formation protein B n=1 Tax=Ferrovum sp. JA12 TaxID=1356299 RepID=UPI000702FDAF|nr:disulfide bond formation protein B [Ferrovum sp. JA12]OYV80423.1 MAG: disulfide bond formation protein B [Ferrovum sp. 21-44-67]OYV94738.1 MAG: disulfide bond formation protein B [Ferrovum sp. 37-45-19]OZB31877.1 MAG: disulfide bond formation protein B [Ferrovum sp. 34-44-207]HQT81146.1 disulfide bond formation protein B [Ferrovaceae bacterium]KRH79127.1 disulfide bond formation protein B [Ferrovum sp. JA12]